MNFKKNHTILLLIAYFIAHGGILLIPNAIYWDDWIFYSSDSSVIFDTFRQWGSMFDLHSHLFILLLKIGPWSFRYLTFFLMFLTGLLLNNILKKYKSINYETRFFIILLFIILPFNTARSSLVIISYTLCYFLFFLAWSLLDRFRIISLMLFFLSFNTNSLLVFYAVPFLDFMFRNGYFSSWRNVSKFGIRNIDLILLPFVYFFIKIKYFPPNGLYSGYNQNYSIINLITAPTNQLVDLFLVKINFGLTCLFALIAFFMFRANTLAMQSEKRIPSALFCTGLITLILGAFPYWILGHIPTFNGWGSRHQLLLPLGFSLMVIGAWLYLKESFTIIYIIIGVSISFNLMAYKDFFFDWQKQQQLISLFSKNPDIRNGSLIIFVDDTTHKNVYGRMFHFFEWNGMLKTAFGDEKRFGIIQSELPKYLEGQVPYTSKFMSPLYLAGSFNRESHEPPIKVEINMINPEGFKARLLKQVYPQFNIKVTRIDMSQLDKL